MCSQEGCYEKSGQVMVGYSKNYDNSGKFVLPSSCFMVPNSPELSFLKLLLFVILLALEICY